MLELTVKSVQVGALNVPPAPPSLHDTVPVGVDGVPVLVSVTVAVTVIAFPIVTDELLGAITVLVVRKVTVRVDVPELPPCAESPE